MVLYLGAEGFVGVVTVLHRTPICYVAAGFHMWLFPVAHEGVVYGHSHDSIFQLQQHLCVIRNFCTRSRHLIEMHNTILEKGCVFPIRLHWEGCNVAGAIIVVRWAAVVVVVALALLVVAVVGVIVAAARGGVVGGVAVVLAL